MRLRPVVVAAALSLGGLHSANAQSTGTGGGGAPPPVITQSKIALTAEDRYVIKEVVLKEQPGAAPPAGVSSEIGASVPQDVQTQPFPQIVKDKVPQIRPFTYFVKGGEVVVVDPKDSRVVETIH